VLGDGKPFAYAHLMIGSTSVAPSSFALSHAAGNFSCVALRSVARNFVGHWYSPVFAGLPFDHWSWPLQANWDFRPCVYTTCGHIRGSERIQETMLLLGVNSQGRIGGTGRVAEKHQTAEIPRVNTRV
jgi:hypothetical protein